MNPNKQKRRKRLELTPEDKEKVRRLRGLTDEKDDVDLEWYLIGEFGYYFGWDGIEAILSNKISLPEVLTLLKAADKVWYKKLVQSSRGNMIAHMASKAKSPADALRKGLSDFITKMQVRSDG